jgi:L-alanine-DL-glutamate epimerase-like enolase superfamily enzyme
VRDSEGHGHPGPEHDAVQSLLTITTDDGATGHCFGAVNEGALAAWLNESVDPMDAEGYVHVSDKPGLGLNINFDYLRDHLVPG